MYKHPFFVPSLLFCCFTNSFVSVYSSRITGLSMPTSFALDTDGRVWISEKNGVIKLANNVNSTEIVTIIDFSDKVASYGDLGLTSLRVTSNYVYVAYQATNATFGPGMINCTDYGEVNGRDPAVVYGCVTHGIVSRFPIQGTNRSLLGPEEILFNNSNICTQFGTGGIADILLSPDTTQLYVSVGAGGNANTDAIPDIGQYGNDPCGGGGHLRAQDPSSFDGSIFRLNITDTVPRNRPYTPTEIELIAKGFFNPWRMAWKNSSYLPGLYVIDTGLIDREELNGPIPYTFSVSPNGYIIENVNNSHGNNYGFPCTHGNVTLAEFNAPNLDPPPTVCRDMALNASLYTPPVWFSYHPNEPSVFSAVVYHPTNDRWYIGDMMQMMIFSIPGSASYRNFNPNDKRIEAVGLFPVHLLYLPVNNSLLMLDVLNGQILSQDVWPLPPSPSAGPNNNPVSSASSIVLRYRMDESTVSYVFIAATFLTLLSTMSFPSLFLF